MRSGDLVTFKGTVVNLQVLRDLLEREPSIQEYQIVIRPTDAQDELSMDELLIRLSVAPGTERQMESAVSAATTRTAHLSPRLQFVESDEIFDPARSPKPVRVLDLRPTSA